MSTNPLDPRLFELFCGAIEKAVEYVRLAETGKTHVGPHLNWPELRWHDNGLPWITHTSFDTPRNYSDAVRGLYSALHGLTPGGEPPLDFGKELNFLALVAYAKTQPRLQEYFMYEKEGAFDFFASHLKAMVAGALDRYIHINKTSELVRDKLLPVYLPMEKHLFDETLSFTAIVPILFLKFELQQFHINESISVERLSDELHLARGWQGSWGHPDNFIVESAATHALFIRNRSLANENWLKTSQAIMTPESYPVEEINTFFAALRIATGYLTGYAQMLALPMEWVSFYAADLIPIDGPTVENYPPFFKSGYWQSEVPTVNFGGADRIREVFNDLQRVFATKHAQRVHLAMHRLNLSSMRTTEEDGVIDSMIAMEALLSDGAQEMTHKVAMRLAGLYKIADRSRSEQAFKEMKDIYTFRSKIVHGSATLERHRQVDREGIKISVADAAVEHLRNAFGVLIKNPALLDPKGIDSFLLTDKL